MEHSRSDFWTNRKCHRCFTASPEYSLRMPSKQQVHRTFLAIFFIHIFTLQVLPANAARSEYTCEPGDKLPTFDGCDCGEYASFVTKNERLEFEEMDAMVYLYRPDGVRRKMWYICIKCTLCGDGILVDSPCSTHADTKCSSTSACADSTWKFDYGSKSCKPPSPLQPQPSTVLAPMIARTPATRPTPNSHRDESPVDNDEGTHYSALWSQTQSQIIFFGLMGVLVLLLIVLLVIVIVIIQIKRNLQEIVRSPYSSHNTSNSSVNV